jgi:geranylgeranyl reductase family protein
LQTYDVIIVGGGPSGSTAGFLLKKAGFKVLIIDKKEFPRDKLCGGLVTQKSINFLNDIFGENFTSSVVEDIKNSVEIYFKNKLISSFSTNVPFYLVDRKKFDFYILKRYLGIGGEFRSKTSFNSIDFSKNQIQLTNEDILGFKYLIGADGALSQVRKYVEPDFKPSGYCLETFITSKNPDNSLKVYFGDLKIGYGWIFPRKNVNVVGIGADFNLNRIRFNRSFEDINRIVSDFVQKPKGAFIPFGEMVEKPVRDNKIFLIGDAAGFVDPVTGEGIYYALKSGEMVSKALIEEDNQLSAEEIYLNYIKGIQKEIKKRKPVRKIVFGRGNGLIFNSLGRFKPLVRYVCDNIISL